MPADPDNAERVLLLLEEENDLLLEIGLELAARRGLELVGLFVEDSDLLSTSGLPFAREIGMASGISRPLRAENVERLMRERAQRLQSRLERLGRERGIHAALEVGRGRRPSVVVQRLRPNDLLILRRGDWARRPAGTIEGILGEAACSVMLVDPRPGRRFQGPMVLVDGSEASTRALSRAMALARRESETLTLLLLPGAGDADTRERLRRLLAGHGLQARFVELRRANLLEVVRAARRERPGLLFIPRESELLRTPVNRWLQELDELPLVLVP